ncbi:MAG: hypothetical protein AAFO94_22070, partial [Bacteroidota bacterium]
SDGLNRRQDFSRQGFEFSPNNKVFTFDGYFKYSPAPKKASSYAWKTALQAPAVIAPQIIVDERGEHSILIQDEQHFLYRINTNGEILWRKSLPGKILSPIQSIRTDDSAPAVYAFNTDQHIYLMDAAGVPMPSFPIHLQSPATNGMTVVDFANRREFAFYLACANGNVYGFDLRGRPITGWNPLSGVGQVTKAIRHFQKGPNDFFVMQNEAGHLLGFRRNGQARFDLPTAARAFLSGPDFQVSGQSSRIVTTDVNGNVYVSTLRGNTFKLAMEVGDNQAMQFQFADVFGDSRKDYIGLNKAHLACYWYEDNAFLKAFEYEFDVPQSEVFPVQLQGED